MTEKKHYSDYNGENVVHMPTPFAFGIGPDYDYLRRGPLGTFFYYLIHSLAIILLWPYFLLVNGFRVRGLANARAMRGRGVVAICNHAHLMDSPMASCALGLRRTYAVTIASNFCIPVVRHLVRALGGVPLDGSLSQMRRLFAAMHDALAAGSAVLMYPEGVLVPYSGELRPFRSGAFKMACDADAPVLPLRITFRAPTGLWRHLRKKPFVTLTVLPAICPDKALPPRERSADLQRKCESAMSAVE